MSASLSNRRSASTPRDIWTRFATFGLRPGGPGATRNLTATEGQRAATARARPSAASLESTAPTTIGRARHPAARPRPSRGEAGGGAVQRAQGHEHPVGRHRVETEVAHAAHRGERPHREPPIDDGREQPDAEKEAPEGAHAGIVPAQRARPKVRVLTNS